MQVILFFAQLMDTVHKCVIIAGNYIDLVSGEAMSSREVNSVFIVTNIFTSWVSVPVQIYFAWRIWRFKNPIRWAFVVFLAPCILFHFGTSEPLPIFFLVLTESHGSYGNCYGYRNLDTTQQSDRNLEVNLEVEAATDVILAIGLCILLWQTYLEVLSGESIVQRLVLLTITTGVWTAMFGVLTMAMAIKYPGHLTHIAFCFIIAPIYDNMFLANLNARSYIREGVDRVIEFEKSGATSGLSSVRDRSIQMVSKLKGSQRDTTLIDSKNSTAEGRMQIRMETVRYEKYDNVPLT
ncbi:hypothetical protein H1R20_g10913, partial [Candolleomyces eurysporus]